MAAVALNGAVDFVPELNKWLQLVDMSFDFRMKLTIIMLLDYGGAWAIDKVLKRSLADIKPRPSKQAFLVAVLLSANRYLPICSHHAWARAKGS